MVLFKEFFIVRSVFFSSLIKQFAVFKSAYLSILFLKYIFKNPLRSLSALEGKLASHSVCLQAQRLAVARCEDGFF